MQIWIFLTITVGITLIDRLSDEDEIFNLGIKEQATKKKNKTIKNFL